MRRCVPLALIVVGTVLGASCTSQETGPVRTPQPPRVDGSPSGGVPALVGRSLVRAIHLLRAEGHRVGSVTARWASAPK